MNKKMVSLTGCILLAVLVCLSVFPLGCSPTLVGQNAAVYSMGRLHARVDREMDAVYEASVKALEELEVTVTEKKKDVFAARVYGETSDEKNITIKIEPETDESTLLSIHTGVVGDEVRARTIFSKIREILGSADEG
jgi:hypothetical protein